MEGVNRKVEETGSNSGGGGGLSIIRKRSPPHNTTNNNTNNTPTLQRNPSNQSNQSNQHFTPSMLMPTQPTPSQGMTQQINSNEITVMEGWLYKRSNNLKRIGRTPKKWKDFHFTLYTSGAFICHLGCTTTTTSSNSTVSSWNTVPQGNTNNNDNNNNTTTTGSRPTTPNHSSPIPVLVPSAITTTTITTTTAAATPITSTKTTNITNTNNLGASIITPTNPLQINTTPNTANTNNTTTPNNHSNVNTNNNNTTTTTNSSFQLTPFCTVSEIYIGEKRKESSSSSLSSTTTILKKEEIPSSSLSIGSSDDNNSNNNNNNNNNNISSDGGIRILPNNDSPTTPLTTKEDYNPSGEEDNDPFEMEDCNTISTPPMANISKKEIREATTTNNNSSSNSRGVNNNNSGGGDGENGNHGIHGGTPNVNTKSSGSEGNNGNSSSGSKEKIFCIRISWLTGTVDGNGTGIDSTGLTHTPNAKDNTYMDDIPILSPETPTNNAGMTTATVGGETPYHHPMEDLYLEEPITPLSEVASLTCDENEIPPPYPNSSSSTAVSQPKLMSNDKKKKKRRISKSLLKPRLKFRRSNTQRIEEEESTASDNHCGNATPNSSGSRQEQFFVDSPMEEGTSTNVSPEMLRQSNITTPRRRGHRRRRTSDEALLTASNTSSTSANGTEPNTISTPNEKPSLTTITTPLIISNAQEGIHKHYHQQLEEEETQRKARSEEQMNLMYLENKHNQKDKKFKRVAKGGQYAAAAGAVITAGVFSAGIGLVLGLVFVGITAAAGGGSAVANVGYRRRKGRVTVVIAAKSLEEAKKWKAAIECVIEELRVSYESSIHKDGGSVQQQNSDLEDDIAGGSGSGTGMVSSQKPSHSTKNSYINLADVFGCRENNEKDDSSLNENSYVEPTGRKWVPIDGGWTSVLGFGAHGLRMYKEEEAIGTNDAESISERLLRLLPQSSNDSSVLRNQEEKNTPLLKSQVILNASPLDAFMTLMVQGTVESEESGKQDTGSVISTQVNSGQRSSFRVLETLDENSDIIHLFFRPLYLFPFWTKPRDFVLFRHWRHESNRTYVIFYCSVEHPDCPPLPTHTRGNMHGIYTIAPEKHPKNIKTTANYGTCLLTHMVEVDPKGWVPKAPIPLFSGQGYAEAFGIASMSVSLDVRDAIELNKYVSVSLEEKRPIRKDLIRTYVRGIQQSDDFTSSNKQLIHGLEQTTSNDTADLIGEEDYDNYDYRFSNQEITQFGTRSRTSTSDSFTDLVGKKFESYPDPTPLHKWAEPDANSFRIRGKTYKKDYKKFNAGQSLMRLITVDILKCDVQMFGGVCTQPSQRVQKGLAREAKAKAKGLSSDMPEFIFAVNLIIQGPPHYHMVYYFGIDDSKLIDGSSGTPWSKLTKKFFFGESDEYRDKTFKLIPQIIEGNFLVRKAAKSTPVIMGTKMKQIYICSDRFCEVIVDLGSSSVSAAVLKLCSGYSKQIVVDMAFLMEGDEEESLPEKILGCVRLKHVDLQKDSRLVQSEDVV